MTKHYQESEVEFRRENCDGETYPHIRGIVVHAYGGTLEEIVAAARKQHGLSSEWKVIAADVKP